MATRRIKVAAALLVLAALAASYLAYTRWGSGSPESLGRLEPAESLREIIEGVSSLSYTMSLSNQSYSDSYTVTYRVVGTQGDYRVIMVQVSKPPMNITLRINRENGTVYEVVVDNGTRSMTYNETMAPYVGFNVLKDALMPLVNPSMMSQIIDWSTLTSRDEGFQLRLEGKEEIALSGRRYLAYTLVISQAEGASNPIPGFYNMTYVVLDWRGTPVLYEMSVHRAEGTVSMHLDSFEPAG